MAPSVAPAAMKPNRRLPCSVLNRSTTSAQNTETTNRLNTLVQMKNTRPAQTAASPDRKCCAAANIRMLSAKKR